MKYDVGDRVWFAGEVVAVYRGVRENQHEPKTMYKIRIEGWDPDPAYLFRDIPLDAHILLDEDDKDLMDSATFKLLRENNEDLTDPNE